jgi:hypothetical protein
LAARWSPRRELSDGPREVVLAADASARRSPTAFADASASRRFAHLPAVEVASLALSPYATERPTTTTTTTLTRVNRLRIAPRPSYARCDAGDGETPHTHAERVLRRRAVPVTLLAERGTERALRWGEPVSRLGGTRRIWGSCASQAVMPRSAARWFTGRARPRAWPGSTGRAVRSSCAMTARAGPAFTDTGLVWLPLVISRERLVSDRGVEVPSQAAERRRGTGGGGHCSTSRCTRTELEL